MNRENTENALAYLQQLAPANLRMGSWFGVSDACGVSEAEECGWGSQQCGTPACFAGHVQARFAVDGERQMDADTFSVAFLGIPTLRASDVFINSETYGHKYLGAVRMEDVTGLIERALAANSWEAVLTTP